MKLFDHTVMAHSDTEEVYETTDPGLKQLNLTDSLGDTETYEKTIHSGHFMISHVHDENVLDRCNDLDDQLDKEDSPDYVYDVGKQSIDPSFTELFQCMSLVEKYFSTSGKLTSPKWKNFKGIKTFRLKEKIRVNNIIWREWHMQYVKCLPPILCHFSSSLVSQLDGKGNSVDVMCKRNVKVMTKDYNKWRHYNKRLIGKNNVQDVLSSNSSYCEILQRTSENNSKRLTNLGGIVKKSLYPNPSNQLLMDEDIFNEFSDTLFMMEGSNLKEMPAFSDENFNDVLVDGCLNDMDTLEPFQHMFRCESLNFNKAYSTPSVQPSTMLTNAQECDVRGQRNLALLNDNLLNLPLDMPQNVNLVDKQMDFRPSEHLMSLLAPTQPTSESHVVNNTSFHDLQMGNRKNDFVIDGIFNVSGSSNFNIEVQPSPNIILSSQKTTPENVVGVLYTTNGSNDFHSSQSPQSMPLLSGLLQQQKQPMIIQLPPGYRIITSQDVVDQDNARIEGNNVINFANNFASSHVQSKLQPSHIGSKSLGSLQVIQNLKENKNNLSTGSLATKTTAGFRIPQRQHTKCRQKSSNLVNIHPRPQVFPAMQSSMVKRLLLPTTSQTQSPIQFNRLESPIQFNRLESPIQFNRLESQENDSSHYAGGETATLRKSEKRRRIRNENASSVSVVDEKHSRDHFNSIFQPINPITNSPIQPTNVSNYNTPSLFGTLEQQQLDVNPLKYSLENPICFNDVLFKIPDRTRHASNDSGSSHCEDGFTIGPNKFVNKDLRRISHLTSEQKRRFSIKCGLDTLNELVPGLDANSGSRISKATTLHKAAEFCRKLKANRQELQDEIDRARNEVHNNELAIKNAHSKMPVQGLPSSGSRTHANQMKVWFQKFIQQRSQDNWKYWIFGTIIEPLFSSFEAVVITSSNDQFRQSILRWLMENCSLIILRPIVSNSLRKLSTTTCILVNPEGFRKQVVKRINTMTQSPLQL